MEAKELRIGNCVHEKGRLVIIHDGFGIDHAHNFDTIKITEEWLFKVGFKNKNFKNKYPSERFLIGDINLYYTKQEKFEGYVLSFDNQLIRGVIFVHELQNLYFALTGEELMIKK